MGKKRHKKKNTNQRRNKKPTKAFKLQDSIQVIANVLTIVITVIQLYQLFR